ncbi:hypothetical protein V565_077930 [Rhizoctonia solani 123E]|uniref:Laminin domain protein n=1 Tax=Rhizoctonia solani 123E TaxID=1423351 RepID=A0A074RZ06_9AGAM|nr:hypothetical protein V565_077930 [Rhizoctonia solani 123E]
MTSSALAHENVSLVPPQLPLFLANVINLKPITGIPGREEIKLVHEAVRALNNFPHTSEMRNSDLSIELSQHLFDIQMVCHRQKYPTSVLPNDVIYDPPTLPAYIPIELKTVTGSPSNEDVASVHTALRISESFVNVPSIFDPDLHARLSQHLFDIQLARHIQRSIMKRSTPQNQVISHIEPEDTQPKDNSSTHAPLDAASGQVIEPTDPRDPPVEQLSSSNKVNINQNQNERNEAHRATEIMVEIRDKLDKLDDLSRILVGTQNSLARGFNSSSYHYRNNNITYDLGGHSLINDHGEVPETYNLPTFKSSGNRGNVSLVVNNLPENELARYLRFYNLGGEMIEEGEELKIKSGMISDARTALSHRLFLNRR